MNRAARRAHRKFNADRKAILERGNLKELAGFMKQAMGRNPSSQHVVEITLHKMRLETLELSEQMRRDSANWLLLRGYSRLSGLDVPLPNEPLPTTCPLRDAYVAHQEQHDA